MPRAILDENVSLQVAARLEALGYEVTAISKHPERGMQDEAVFALAKGCILVTRDAHFTNPVNFNGFYQLRQRPREWDELK